MKCKKIFINILESKDTIQEINDVIEKDDLQGYHIILENKTPDKFSCEFLVNSQFFKNKKGDVIKYISKKSKYYKKFGEIYFSEIKKNKIKGWIKHTRNTCIICVPSGKVKFFTVKENFKDQKKFILSKKIILAARKINNKPKIKDKILES